MLLHVSLTPAVASGAPPGRGGQAAAPLVESGCAGSGVVAHHWLSCFEACGLLVPGAGIEPKSPALAGGFLTTGPPGKSEGRLFKRLCNGEIGKEGVNVSGID